tara:strand:- start:816 stop:1967 length:1152 start_codon:yes stop_codon:yes gene_type:complete
MFNKFIKFENFLLKKKNKNIIKNFKSLVREYHQGDQLLNSLSNNYNYSFKKKILSKFKKEKTFKVIGMGGSILGSEAIHSFLKCKKKFYFINNLQNSIKNIKKKSSTNIIISKSGNTLEMILNVNLYLKKKDKNIIITEKSNNYLFNLANKLKCEIIEHNNFIGGRYSVLSEVGMVPAILMGYDEKKFKQFNNLIRNKVFVNCLVKNVASIIYLNKNKQNSLILNYDEHSENFFKWYQQLVAESLGKKSKGILPIISTMPKDNHSLIQYFLDGPKKNFYTFFSVNEIKTEKIKNKKFLFNQRNLFNKSVNEIIHAQKNATKNVFLKKNIPFRSFTLNERSEKNLGVLFCFFILETILLGKALNINPFDQPSVELIKTETKKLF